MTQEKSLEILKSGVNVFLTGVPGAGKTHVTKQFIEWLKGQGKYFAVTASTGIAASHLNGKTIHSWSGLGIKRKLNEGQLIAIKNNKWVAKKIFATQVLIIDEVSMLDAHLIDDIDAILRTVRGKDEPFGGVQVVFVGDFFQLPPVTQGKQKFAFESESWKEANLTVCYLTTQHRQNDERFIEILGAMRESTVTEEHKATLLSCKMNEVPDTQLFTHNADVEALNQTELDKLKGKAFSFKMHESGNEKMVETLKKSCLSPENLELKVGAVVMFTRNNFDAGYVNGSIGKVQEFKHGYPLIKLQSGKMVDPEMAEWKFEEDGKTVASIEQLPLRLAWAITVHKSQGMSLDSAAIDLSNTFEYGQGYVAISRVRSLEGLHLKGMNDKAFEMHPKVVEQDKIFRKKGV